MRRLALLTTILFALVGCGGTDGSVNDDEVAGSNRPEKEESTSSSASPSSSEAPPPAPNPTFGRTFTYEDGLSVTVSAPQPYEPSEYAYVGEPAPAAFVAFDVTIVNGTADNYEPAMFNATMQSGNVESSQVFDSEQGMNGSPSTVLLPGREAVFRMAFGAADPADLVLQVTPGFEYDAAIFTS